MTTHLAQRRLLRGAAFTAGVLAGLTGCSESDPVEDEPCTKVCMEVLDREPHKPFVVGFDMRLRNADGSIKAGVSPEHFTIRENGQALDLSETNQFVRSGEGLPLKVMLVLDYSNSMARAQALGPLIEAAESFVESSPFAAEDDLAVISIRRSGQLGSDRILVSDFLPADCQTRERIADGTFALDADPCALGGVWEAVTLAILKLQAEQEPRNRAVIFITDGRDALPATSVRACGASGLAGDVVVASAADLEQLAIDGGVRLIPVGFGNLSGTAPVLADLAERTSGYFAAAQPIDGTSGLAEALGEVGHYLRGLSGPLNAVVVLDYTISSATQEDITGLIAAVRAFVQPDHFNATQQIGVVEFHDRTEEGSGFAEVIGLTSADCAGRARILDAIPRERELEHGQTRLWDAVHLAASKLLEAAESGSATTPAQLAVVFLTDGNDTTSNVTAQTITSLGQDNNVAMYPIDFGQVTDGSTAFGALLTSIAVETGGQYFRAERTTDLVSVFKQIAEELRGQWNLTYITQKNQGQVNVTVEFGWQGLHDEFQYEFNASTIQGEVHQGILEVYDAYYDAQADSTSFRLRARYLPRNVNKFRFLLGEGARLQLQGSGGLTPPSGGWEVCRRGEGRCLEVLRMRGPRHDDAESRPARVDTAAEGEALHFGAFGNLGTITIPGQWEELPIGHDDSIYLDLPQPKTMIFEGAARVLHDLQPCSGACEQDLSPPPPEPEADDPPEPDPAGQIIPQERPRQADANHRSRSLE